MRTDWVSWDPGGVAAELRVRSGAYHNLDSKLIKHVKDRAIN